MRVSGSLQRIQKNSKRTTATAGLQFESRRPSVQRNIYCRGSINGCPLGASSLFALSIHATISRLMEWRRATQPLAAAPLILKHIKSSTRHNYRH